MTKDAKYWSEWFWDSFFVDWLDRVIDDHGGVFDALDVDGKPDLSSGKTLLSQARTLFTLSHVAILSGDQGLVEIARKQAKFLENFQKSPGLYRSKVNRNGSPTRNSEDEIARSYDQTFVILGLVTWNKVSPSNEVSTLINDCWDALVTKLTDPASGLLFNDDSGLNSGPAQNPHMHLYEACLQAFRMTQEAIWLTRAADLRKVGLRYFLDETSGSITEFLTCNLAPLEGAAGQRREIGHQCEWAWLLLEEADLTNNTSLVGTAKHLIAFSDNFGFADDCVVTGAAFDAVSACGQTVDERFLLWPQTEAIKVLSTRHKAREPFAGDRAQRLFCLVFERWFAKRPFFCNQLDLDGNSLWDESLTRLMYHLVLAMSEGSKAGLWPHIPANILK